MTKAENPRPREVRVFPVVEQAVTATLRTIEGNPQGVLLIGLESLNKNHRPLLTSVRMMAEVLQELGTIDNDKEMYRGASFTYTILTNHAEREGGALPVVTNSIEAARESLAETVKTFHERSDEPFLYETVWRKLQKDPEYQALARGVLEMVKYQTNKEDFLLGAYLTIAPFREKQRAETMERMFDDGEGK